MKILYKFLLLQIFMAFMVLITAQWCVSFKSVVKSRTQWNNGLRLITKKNFFGGIKYKYEPYVYSTVQNYNDYERVTVCCDGFTAVSDTKCEPVCKPSCPPNTHCIRPDICECDIGYRGYTDTALNVQCEPFCRPACSQNAQCIQPNKCVCNSGYEDEDGNGSVCQAICEKGCPENSICAQPNQCVCQTGYLDNGLGECLPVCSQKCPDHSVCTKPDTCECNENYEDKEDKCVPICEEACPQHAECVKPNECQCMEGYEAIDKLNATSFLCVPKCDEGCPDFANCTQPNVCECQLGYGKTETNLCQAVCENECPQHSNCTKPNTCSCEKGFVMLEQQCQPICEKACPDHSSCKEPNKCLCDSGYQLKLSSIYNLYCEPVCQRNCSAFGKCVQPNKCECLEGYEMDELELCQPVCSRGCKNGFCFQPDVCICKPGYLMGPQEECEAVCSIPCQNGSCIEPEICQCYNGYKLQDNSINICEPVCQPECINGICAAPNVCICHENYEAVAVTETGLNHNNCQRVSTTTAKQELMKNETTTKPSNLEANVSTSTLIPVTSTSLHPDKLGLTTTVGTLVSADMCNEQCLCWQEFDEFGLLTAKQCAHLCVDDFDKPCLDLRLCQCDLVKSQLVCRTFYDESIVDDPILYMCNLPRFKGTTLKPAPVPAISSETKSVQSQEDSKWLLWLMIVVGVIVACIIGFLLYLYFNTKEDGDTIIEYEL